MSEVMDALRALQSGEATIDDVATGFSTRSWPKPAGTPTNARDALAAQVADRDPDPDNSFAEVAQAFYQGIITIDQYEVLARAAHEAGSAQSTAPSDAPDAPPEDAPPADAPPEGDPADKEAEDEA